ncbi:DUF4255 domain-containing protein [Falsiroseomonas sp. HW251]|uniref:DUF4255 domain-containing protein n=1 Tax=Falsiroseomonas sp. HW251 TaxID=3390998 RepID=UPI003D314FB4
MAGYGSIAAVGKSLERMLNAAFADRQPVNGQQSRAVLIRTDDLKPINVPSAIGNNALSIFLYRVDFDRTMRAAWSAAGVGEGRGQLAVALHFLLTPWADNAEHEQLILGRAMQALETTPTLTGPLLYQPPIPFADEPQPPAGEAVHLMMEEVSTEALMRTFDSLPTDYRVSVPYVARVVRIATREARNAPPVTDANLRIGVTA